MKRINAIINDIRRQLKDDAELRVVICKLSFAFKGFCQLGKEKSMSAEEGLMELSKLFTVTSIREGKYLVEEANPDSDYSFFASYYKGEWTYSMSGVGNHGTDWIDIDIDKLEKLKKFCELISEKTKGVKGVDDAYSLLGKCYPEACDNSSWMK